MTLALKAGIHKWDLNHQVPAKYTVMQSNIVAKLAIVYLASYPARACRTMAGNP